jgi:hypothetical protein
LARVILASVLAELCPVMDAVRTLAVAGSERGAIFTRREVADFVTGLVVHIAAEAERS